MTDAPSATPFEIEDLTKTIQRLNERYTRAHVDGDVATIDAMFTRDATCMPPGEEALIGRAAIHDLTVAYVAGGVKAFRMDTLRCDGNAALVVEQGTYVMTYGPDDVVERGKYLNVWKPEDGAWKLYANIWNARP
jgi:uncharacterized protein (TIGR02246 family)